MRNKCIRLIAFILIYLMLSAGCSASNSGNTDAYNIIECSVKKIAYDEKINSSGNAVLCGEGGDGISLEYISLALKNPIQDGGIDYQLHIQSVGWTDWLHNGKPGGEQDSGKRIEAVKIQLSGKMALSYNIYYRVYVTDMGWSAWSLNGETAGTEGMSKGIEAIEIRLIPEGGILPEESTVSDTEKEVVVIPELDYSIYLQDSGWISGNGEYAGRPEGGKKAEGFSMSISDCIYSGSVIYREYAETYGWLDWVSDSTYSGIYNESKRMEAIQINLTEELAERFDIYYRVYVENRGWLGWAVNGQSAGTKDFKLMIEAYQVVLVGKGSEAPGETIFASIAPDASVISVDTVLLTEYAVSRLEAVGRYYAADTEAFKNRNGDYDEDANNTGKETFAQSDLDEYCEENFYWGLVQVDISQAGDNINEYCSDRILEFYSDKNPKATFYVKYEGCTMDGVLVFKCYYNRE